MIYLNLLLVWCVIGFYLSYVSFLVGFNMFHLSLYFLIGFFMILGSGFIDTIRENKKRNK